MKHVATAFYQDTYAGRIAVYLKPFKTKRHGQPCVFYRWQSDRGAGLPYIPARRPGMTVAMALLSPLFDSVACDVDAREHFNQETRT